METRKGELSKLVLRSLTNIRVAKSRFLPLSTNLSNAAALAIQIKVRDDFLCNIHRIRVGLVRRIMRANSANRRSTTARKGYRNHRARGARTGGSGAAGRTRS